MTATEAATRDNKVGLPTMTAMVIGSMIGSGVFLLPRRFGAETVRQTPAVLGAAPATIRGRRVLIVDETCDTGDTIRLAVAAAANAGASEVRTAVAFRTGDYAPDFHALATESTIILPWDREILIDGDLVPNPLYAEALEAEE